MIGHFEIRNTFLYPRLLVTGYVLCHFHVRESTYIKFNPFSINEQIRGQELNLVIFVFFRSNIIECNIIFEKRVSQKAPNSPSRPDL